MSQVKANPSLTGEDKEVRSRECIGYVLVITPYATKHQQYAFILVYNKGDLGCCDKCFQG